MQQNAVLAQLGPSRQVAMASKDDEPGLKVVTVYQDPLTRHWATELWERVEQLISGEGVCRQSWKISDLTDPRVFMDAVQAAAEADVLVVSVRDTRELPIGLYVWIDSWIPSRAGPAGALVALIGVPPEPDAQSGRAYQYLESVARKAGLDFLPHERKLPEQPSTLSNSGKIGHTVSRAIPLAAGTFNSTPRAHLHWRLLE
jgi:hypothetical protein